eukprot:4441438-Pleurochrysis_carterae.AAC.3
MAGNRFLAGGGLVADKTVGAERARRKGAKQTFARECGGDAPPPSCAAYSPYFERSRSPRS